MRAFQLVVANARDDDAAREAVYDELGNCAQCLRNLLAFMTSLAASLGSTVAETAGATHADAIRRWEAMLADAMEELPPSRR